MDYPPFHKKHISEKCSKYKTRIYEHRKDLHWNNPLNSLVSHGSHNFDYKTFTKKILRKNINK